VATVTDLSPEIAELFQTARRVTSSADLSIAAASEAIVLALHALTLQLAKNAENRDEHAFWEREL